MKFEEFQKEAEKHGLAVRQCAEYHWQIRSEEMIVNYYPTTGTLFINGTTKGRSVFNLMDVIKAAMQAPPLIDKKVERKSRTWSFAERKRLSAVIKNCFWCGKPFSKYNKPTLEHIIPLARGGSNLRDNLTLACHSCNKARGHNMPNLDR